MCAELPVFSVSLFLEDTLKIKGNFSKQTIAIFRVRHLNKSGKWCLYSESTSYCSLRPHYLILIICYYFIILFWAPLQSRGRWWHTYSLDQQETIIMLSLNEMRSWFPTRLMESCLWQPAWLHSFTLDGTEMKGKVQQLQKTKKPGRMERREKTNRGGRD